MANVQFKKGLQSALNKYLYTYNGSDAEQAVEGAFYLTTDTNRLYIGKDVGSSGNSSIKAVPVNQGAISVDTVNNLPNPAAAISGQFYYVVSDNILCVSSGTHWIQINTDTNTDNYIVERTISGVKNSSTNTVSVEDILFNSKGLKIQDQMDYTAGAGLDIDVTPKYVKTNYTKLLAGIIYYTKSKSDETYTPVSSPTSSELSDYYIQDGYKLVFTPKKYTLSASSSTITQAELTLSNTSSTSTVQLSAGDNILYAMDSGKLKISATDSKVTKVQGSSADTGFNIAVTVGGTKTGNIDPQITIGKNTGYKKSTHFTSGTATLDVYTTDEIDKLIKDFNAVEYKGTVATGNIPTSNVKNGYMYMVSGSIPSTQFNGSVDAKAGDLLIAKGTEGTDGYLTTIAWDLVPAGNDTDTQPTFALIDDNGFAIGKSTGGTLGTYKIKGDNYIIVSSSDSNGNKERMVSFSHNLINLPAATWQLLSDQTMAQGTTSTDASIAISVPTITWDTAGHITGFTQRQYTVYDTHGKVTEFSLGASITNSSSATVTSSFKFDGKLESATMNITSSSLVLSQLSTDNLAIDLVWGSF